MVQLLAKIVSPVSVQRWSVALAVNVLLDVYPVVHWLLADDLGPLHSGCCEWFCSGIHRQLMLSVSALPSVSCLAVSLMKCSPTAVTCDVIMMMSYIPPVLLPVFRVHQLNVSKGLREVLTFSDLMILAKATYCGLGLAWRGSVCVWMRQTLQVFSSISSVRNWINPQWLA